MQAYGDDGEEPDNEGVDFVCESCISVEVATVVEFAAVDSDDDDCGGELEGSQGGAEVDSCEAGFVPVLLEGGSFGVGCF